MILEIVQHVLDLLRYVNLGGTLAMLLVSFSRQIINSDRRH